MHKRASSGPETHVYACFRSFPHHILIKKLNSFINYLTYKVLVLSKYGGEDLKHA